MTARASAIRLKSSKASKLTVRLLLLLVFAVGNAVILYGLSRGINRCTQATFDNLANLNASINNAVASDHVNVGDKYAGFPDLFIYRRSRKSGSSSMLAALLDLLQPLGYHATYFNPGPETNHSLRFLFTSSSGPARVFVGEHNAVTRAYMPEKRAVIADTVRDGFEQITSLCRYTRGVTGCDDDMVQCMRSSWALKEMSFRWAGASEETEDNYIDLPLSSAHPSLSTAVLKIVYPDIKRVNVHKYHVRKTHCQKDKHLVQVYNSLYKKMDADVRKLKVRMLILAGYPYQSVARNVSLDDMLDAAEKEEARKYAGTDINAENGEEEVHNGISQQQRQLLMTLKKWVKDSAGKVRLANRRST